MTKKPIDNWIELLSDRSKAGDIGEYFHREQCAELLEFLNELKRSKEFIDEYCCQNRTIDQCIRCELYDRGLCVDKDLAIQCRERVKIHLHLSVDKERDKDGRE